MATSHYIRQHVALKVTALRKAAKLTQDAAAGLAGISRTTLVNIERCHQGLTLETLYLLAGTYGCGIGDILPSVEDHNKPPEKVLVRFQGKDYHIDSDTMIQILFNSESHASGEPNDSTTCVHFTGMRDDEATCKAGVCYRELVGGHDFGWMRRAPCFDDQQGTIGCAHKRHPTDEEVARSEK